MTEEIKVPLFRKVLSDVECIHHYGLDFYLSQERYPKPYLHYLTVRVPSKHAASYHRGQLPKTKE